MPTETREEWGVCLPRVYRRPSEEEARRDVVRYREDGEDAWVVRRVVAVTYGEWEEVPDAG